MKKLTYLWLTMLVLLFAVACDKNDDPVIDNGTLELVDVSFEINDFIPPAAKDNGKQAEDENLPICSDLEADYVMIGINGEAPKMLKLVTINDSMETEVMKLLPNNENIPAYTIESFVVYNNNGTPDDTSDDTPIYASPTNGSYYQSLWSLDGVVKEFTVEAFVKTKVTIDVLCYKPFQYTEFGFAWFQYAKYQVKTICFYGDICTKFFDEFHAERSPYFGQEYNGYDFPAIFEIVVKNEEGDVVNDPDMNSNVEWYGTGRTLCVEYPDLVGVDEAFTFDILLAMPNGEYVSVYTGNFTDANWSGAELEDNFGGADGVFDFVVGNCSYDGNDANIELPAYLPVPETANMATSFGPGGFNIFEFYMTFTNILPAPIPGLFEENIAYRTLCGEEEVEILVPGNYFVEFYSSLDYLEPTSLIPAPYNTYPWGSMNYLANNCGIVDGIPTTYTWQEIQEAIWYIMRPGASGSLGVNNQLAQDSMAVPGFVPSVGDYACVLVVPFEITNGTREAVENASQLLLMRIDP